MKTLLVLTLTACALVAQAAQLLLQPGINVLATSAAHFPIVYGTNNGNAVTVKVYDANDVTQFSLVTNAVDIVPIGTPFPPPQVVTTLRPVIQKTFQANAVARLMDRDYTNGCIVVISGTNAHSISTSIPLP